MVYIYLLLKQNRSLDKIMVNVVLTLTETFSVELIARNKVVTCCIVDSLDM
mgnify:FL=1